MHVLKYIVTGAAALITIGCFMVGLLLGACFMVFLWLGLLKEILC